MTTRPSGRRPAGVLGGLLLVLGLGLAPVAQALDGESASSAGAVPTATSAEGDRVEPVLPATREPGVPALWRLHLGDAVLTVGVGPLRPGPNLVRIDGGGDTTVRVDLPGHDPVRTHSRPGTDGSWAVVDLPTGSSVLSVTHGQRRALLPVDTGLRRVDTSLWTGPQGPECLSAATAELLSAQDGTGACPAAVLGRDDAATLRSTVAALASRDVPAIGLEAGTSTRGAAAAAVVRREALRWALPVLPGDAQLPPGSALLLVSGWSEAARSLRAAPPEVTPWVAPWLLAPGVVAEAREVVVALDFPERGADAYAARLRSLLPGQAPTASGYAAWRGRLGEAPSQPGLFTARAAGVPLRAGADVGDASLPWFTGGSLVPLIP